MLTNDQGSLDPDNENKNQSESVNSLTESSSLILTNKPQVLIVEDHKDMQTYIVQCLEQEYDCIVADNGEHGIKMALSLIPDLIVINQDCYLFHTSILYLLINYFIKQLSHCYLMIYFDLLISVLVTTGSSVHFFGSYLNVNQ